MVMKITNDLYLESAVPGLHTHESLVPTNGGFLVPLTQVEVMASFDLMVGLHLDVVMLTCHFLYPDWLLPFPK